MVYPLITKTNQAATPLNKYKPLNWNDTELYKNASITVSANNGEHQGTPAEEYDPSEGKYVNYLNDKRYIQNGSGSIIRISFTYVVTNETNEESKAHWQFRTANAGEYTPELIGTSGTINQILDLSIYPRYYTMNSQRWDRWEEPWYVAARCTNGSVTLSNIKVEYAMTYNESEIVYGTDITGEWSPFSDNPNQNGVWAEVRMRNAASNETQLYNNEFSTYLTKLNSDFTYNLPFGNNSGTSAREVTLTLNDYNFTYPWDTLRGNRSLKFILDKNKSTDLYRTTNGYVLCNNVQLFRFNTDSSSSINYIEYYNRQLNNVVITRQKDGLDSIVNNCGTAGCIPGIAQKMKVHFYGNSYDSFDEAYFCFTYTNTLYIKASVLGTYASRIDTNEDIKIVITQGNEVNVTNIQYDNRCDAYRLDLASSISTLPRRLIFKAKDIDASGYNMATNTVYKIQSRVLNKDISDEAKETVEAEFTKDESSSGWYFKFENITPSLEDYKFATSIGGSLITPKYYTQYDTEGTELSLYAKRPNENLGELIAYSIQSQVQILFTKYHKVHFTIPEDWSRHEVYTYIWDFCDNYKIYDQTMQQQLKYTLYYNRENNSVDLYKDDTSGLQPYYIQLLTDIAPRTDSPEQEEKYETHNWGVKQPVLHEFAARKRQIKHLDTQSAIYSVYDFISDDNDIIGYHYGEFEVSKNRVQGQDATRLYIPSTPWNNASHSQSLGKSAYGVYNTQNKAFELRVEGGASAAQSLSNQYQDKNNGMLVDAYVNGKYSPCFIDYNDDGYLHPITWRSRNVFGGVRIMQPISFDKDLTTDLGATMTDLYNFTYGDLTGTNSYYLFSDGFRNQKSIIECSSDETLDTSSCKVALAYTSQNIVEKTVYYTNSLPTNSTAIDHIEVDKDTYTANEFTISGDTLTLDPWKGETTPESYTVHYDPIKLGLNSTYNDDFSDWSKETLLKIIQEPQFEITNTTNKIADCDSVGIGFTFSDPVSFEGLKSYKIYIENEDNKYYSDWMAGHNTPAAEKDIYYYIVPDPVEEGNYTVTIEYITTNGYQSTVTLDTVISVSAAGVCRPDVVFECAANDEACRIEVKMHGLVEGLGYVLRRTVDGKHWDDIYRFIATDDSDLYYDYTVTSGISYRYGIQRYYTTTGNDYHRGGMAKDYHQVILNSQHMCLVRGDRVLKIAYNPTVSNFERTILSEKTDTIGGKYPIIKQNAQVNYRTFPIGGLISMQADEEQAFWWKEKEQPYIDYNIINEVMDEYDNIAERKFREEAMEFLYDSSACLFTSPSEGAIIVKLTDVKFAPEQQLGRMLYSFTATATEVMDNTVDNLAAWNMLARGTMIEDGVVINAMSVTKVTNKTTDEIKPYTYITKLHLKNKNTGSQEAVVRIKDTTSIEPTNYTFSDYLDLEMADGVYITHVAVLDESSVDITYSGYDSEFIDNTIPNQPNFIKAISAVPDEATSLAEKIKSESKDKDKYDADGARWLMQHNLQATATLIYCYSFPITITLGDINNVFQELGVPVQLNYNDALYWFKTRGIDVSIDSNGEIIDLEDDDMDIILNESCWYYIDGTATLEVDNTEEGSIYE